MYDRMKRIIRQREWSRERTLLVSILFFGEGAAVLLALLGIWHSGMLVSVAALISALALFIYVLLAIVFGELAFAPLKPLEEREKRRRLASERLGIQVPRHRESHYEFRISDNSIPEFIGAEWIDTPDDISMWPLIDRLEVDESIRKEMALAYLRLGGNRVHEDRSTRVFHFSYSQSSPGLISEHHVIQGTLGRPPLLRHQLTLTVWTDIR